MIESHPVFQIADHVLDLGMATVILFQVKGVPPFGRR
jgi:hypothetical protein